MEQCPVCKSFMTRVVHHYYDNDLHKAKKVFKCHICGSEWNGKSE